LLSLRSTLETAHYLGMEIARDGKLEAEPLNERKRRN
jgi:hypothetical protein